ncbi:hypothetical protein [Spongiivirga citrea]|uniref:Uncharacterized protein n=1 Tax=Spongiivirga citrea TaxID=1481457 RepID=A0A6M0CK48_9FLAO|nr:hypothetical protein [Spongiivirga citrea]NER17333.1 hypothetical protein [Spongiivirga citrea]
MSQSIKKNWLIGCLVIFTIGLNAQKPNKKDTGVHMVSFSMYGNNPDVTSGQWFATIENGEICFQLTKRKGNQGSFNINICYPQASFANFGESKDRFIWKRESGTMVLNGSFNEKQAMGTYQLSINDDFRSFLKHQGILMSGNDDYSFFKLFLGDVTKSYVTGLKKFDYPSPSIKQLAKLGLHSVSLDYIEAISKTKYRDVDLDMIYKFAIHGVTIDYINALNKIGYGDIQANMLKKFAVHKISIDYIKQLAAAGYSDLDADMIKKFKIHDVSPAYIKSLSAAGYNNLSPNDLKNLATHHIDIDYIKSLVNTSIDKPSASQIKKAKIHHVTSDFIENEIKKGRISKDLSYYIKLKRRRI